LIIIKRSIVFLFILANFSWQKKPAQIEPVEFNRETSEAGSRKDLAET